VPLICQENRIHPPTRFVGFGVNKPGTPRSVWEIFGTDVRDSPRPVSTLEDDGMEMVERVARALCAHDELDWEAQADPMTSGSGDDNQAAYLSAARAAIAAMREPTEAQLNGACEVGPDTNGGCFSYDDARNVWVAMIDAALPAQSMAEIS
jgi:hypothetical protein